MEDSRRSRRRRSRTARPECCHAGGTSSSSGAATGLTNIHDLPDELLELILLRVPCGATLARATVTCRPWRRVISGAGFIRRFRSLHPPLVLGHYFSGSSASFFPTPPPPGRPGEAAAAAGTGRSSRRRRRCRVSSPLDLDFLPCAYDTRSMVLTDCRGRLLAFVRYDYSAVVCDPLARQFREVVLPPTPAPPGRFTPCLGAFLLDADAGAGAGEDDTVVIVPSFSLSNFRVLCVTVVSDDDGRLTARTFVYSARASRWVLLNRTVLQNICHYTRYMEPYHSVFVGRVEGSIVWSGRGGKVIHLDESTGEFSTFALLPEAPPPADDGHWDYRFIYERWNLRVVGRDDGGGGMRLARIVGSDLEVLRCVRDGSGGGAVTVERTVNLPHLTSMEARPGHSWRFLELEMHEAVPAGCVVVVSTAELESADGCRSLLMSRPWS